MNSVKALKCSCCVHKCFFIHITHVFLPHFDVIYFIQSVCNHDIIVLLNFLKRLFIFLLIGVTQVKYLVPETCTKVTHDQQSGKFLLPEICTDYSCVPFGAILIYLSISPDIVVFT